MKSSNMKIPENKLTVQYCLTRKWLLYLVDWGLQINVSKVIKNRNVKYRYFQMHRYLRFTEMI